MELTIDQALQKGIEAHKAGQVQEADRLYTAILKAQPKHPDANHNMGVLAVGVGKVQESLPFFQTALEVNHSTAQFWLSYIDALMKLDRIADAKAMFDQAKEKGAKAEGFDKLEQRLNGSNEALNETVTNNQEVEQDKPNILNILKLDQAIKLARKKSKHGLAVEAKRIYQDILTKFPKNKKAIDGIKALSGGPIGTATKAQDPSQDQLKPLINLYNQGQFQQALRQASQLLKQFSKSVIVYNINGAANAGLGKLETAVESYKKALAIKPDYAEAYNNMGVTLKEQGKLEEAIEAFNKALTITPDYADAYNNMGVALQDQGKPEEAIEAYNKALNIQPYFADAYVNMGNAFKDQGKLEESVKAFSKAIYLKPDLAEAHNNMGNTLQEQGKLQVAVKAYNKALSIKPDYAEAYNNMGVALKDQGKLEEAVEALNNALFNKLDYAEAYYNMGVALKGLVFQKPNPSLQKTITSILNQKIYVRPSGISKAAISLLKFEPSLLRLLEKRSEKNLNQSFQEIVLSLSKLPLLLKLMSVCPMADLELEDVLADIRPYLLSSFTEIKVNSDILRFQSALALQCFTNEYVYNQTCDETKAIHLLENLVEKTLAKGQQPSPHHILSLTTYKALHKYEWCDLLTVTSEIEEVFTRQVIEPRQERYLKPDIPVLGDITNTVSSKVRDQYEESPYPRWVDLGLPLKPLTISKIVNKLSLRIFDHAINEVDAPDILIAGCGTGQHSIGTATRFKNSKVLAIDLSLSSLAYAKRKTEELGITNIDYMQADILDLGKLGRQFDIVESAGVLHHMDDPMAGWSVLTDCLKQGGLMKIGLYSELARQHITQMRDEISQLGIGSSDTAMRFFRSAVINSDSDHHKTLLLTPDFYSLSELRDLLFHVQEHRFTIPLIKGCLIQLGLEFCGFEADKITQKFKLTNSGANDLFDLDKWSVYEESDPNAFFGMYQFWCQKVA